MQGSKLRALSQGRASGGADKDVYRGIQNLPGLGVGCEDLWSQ